MNNTKWEIRNALTKVLPKRKMGDVCSLLNRKLMEKKGKGRKRREIKEGKERKRKN